MTVGGIKIDDAVDIVEGGYSPALHDEKNGR